MLNNLPMLLRMLTKKKEEEEGYSGDPDVLEGELAQPPARITEANGDPEMGGELDENLNPLKRLTQESPIDHPLAVNLSNSTEEEEPGATPLGGRSRSSKFGQEDSPISRLINPAMGAEPEPEEEELSPIPSLARYRDHVAAQPNRDEYKPGLGRKLLGSLAAGAQAFGKNNGGAERTIGRMLDNGYSDDLENWEKEGQSIETLSRGESYEELRKEQRRQHMSQEEANRLERERRMAEDARRESDRVADNARAKAELDRKTTDDERKDRLTNAQIAALARKGDDDNEPKVGTPVRVVNRETGEIGRWTPKKLSDGTIDAPPPGWEEEREPSGTENRARVKSEDLDAKLGRLEELVNNKVHEKVTGLVAGNPVSKEARRLLPESVMNAADSVLGTGPSNDDTREFDNLTEWISNAYLYDRSGAQINDKEFERLKKQTLDSIADPKRFKKNLDALRQYSRRMSGIGPSTTARAETRAGVSAPVSGERATASGAKYRRVE